MFVGQESPLIVEINPSSLASIGIPEFAGAGNLWLWIPAGALRRRRSRSAAAVRLGLEVAALAPTSGDAQTAFFTQPDIAERTSRPYLQGRVRARWGDGEAQGSSTSVATTAGSRWAGGRVASRALAVSIWTPLARGLELRGEAYTGQALAGLGGGGIGQNFGLDSAAVATKGGWVQLNARPVGGWEIGAGLGMDDPDDADLLGGSQRLRNVAAEGPRELAAVTRGAGRGGSLAPDTLRLRRRDGTQVNLPMGFEF